LPFSWPWAKTYTVKCGDGTTKLVYKSVDDAAPFFIPGSKESIGMDVGAQEMASAKFTGAYETKIQGLLVHISELNEGLMMTFRLTYVAYQTDPCSHSQNLQQLLERCSLRSGKRF